MNKAIKKLEVDLEVLRAEQSLQKWAETLNNFEKDWKKFRELQWDSHNYSAVCLSDEIENLHYLKNRISILHNGERIKIYDSKEIIKLEFEIEFLKAKEWVSKCKYKQTNFDEYYKTKSTGGKNE